MTANFRRDNLRFLAFGTAAIALMALASMLLSGAIGGTAFYREVLMGETFLPILSGLIVGGLGIGFYLRAPGQASISDCRMETAKN